MPKIIAGENVNDAKDASEAVLQSLGLGKRLDHRPSTLSGGEQQRVAMARALAPDPKILVADEPTGNLDEETGAQISQLLFSKQKERGMTLVLVTQDQSLARQCDRTLRVRAGEIEGPAEQSTKNRKKSAA